LCADYQPQADEYYTYNDYLFLEKSVNPLAGVSIKIYDQIQKKQISHWGICFFSYSEAGTRRS